MVAGRSMTFYLGDGERAALASWRRSQGIQSDSQALREILRVVAEINMEEQHGPKEIAPAR